MPSRRKEDAAFNCTPLGYLGAAAPKRLFGYFWAVPKVPRPRGTKSPRPSGRGLPVNAQIAPSGAEGAGPGAGGRLVTAKAAENLVEWSSQS